MQSTTLTCTIPLVRGWRVLATTRSGANAPAAGRKSRPTSSGQDK
jgi:hypothetical protein